MEKGGAKQSPKSKLEGTESIEWAFLEDFLSEYVSCKGDESASDCLGWDRIDLELILVPRPEPLQGTFGVRHFCVVMDKMKANICKGVPDLLQVSSFSQLK